MMYDAVTEEYSIYNIDICRTRTDGKISRCAQGTSTACVRQIAIDIFGLGVENGRADAGRDDRTCPVRLNYQEITGTGPGTLFGCPLHTDSGLEKKEARIILIGPWVTCKMVAPVTGTTLKTTGPVPTDSRQ